MRWVIRSRSSSSAASMLSVPYSVKLNDLGLFTMRGLTGPQFLQTVTDQLDQLQADSGGWRPAEGTTTLLGGIPAAVAASGEGYGPDVIEVSSDFRAMNLRSVVCDTHRCHFCPAGSGLVPGWSTGPAGRRFQSRQISRCTGIHLGMSRRPGMNGMSSSSTVARPVM
jgi:hypothetical protein